MEYVQSQGHFSVTLSYSYHVLTSSVIYFWTDERHHGISWFVNQIFGAKSATDPRRISRIQCEKCCLKIMKGSKNVNTEVV